MSSFNLVDRNWIRAMTMAGKEVEVSITDVLTDAQDFLCLTGELPTQVLANTRLLLAILHRSVAGPEDIEHWSEIKSRWADTASAVTEYLTEHYDRFDLLHATTPFYQVSELHSVSGESTGLDALVLESNLAPYIATRSALNLEKLSFSEAARWLVHCQAYDVSGIHTGAIGDPRVKNGKGYGIGTGWAGKIGAVLVQGPNLRDTLLLNLIVPEFANVKTSRSDLPPWEREQLTSSEREYCPEGPQGVVDVYTWQSRRILLSHDGEVITDAIVAQGDRLDPSNKQNIEPMSKWYYSQDQTKKQGEDVYFPIKHNIVTHLWQGLPSLLSSTADPTSATPSTSMPGVISWVEALKYYGQWDTETISVRALGLTYDKNNAALRTVIDDQLVLPTYILSRPEEYTLLLEDILKTTEEAITALVIFGRNLRIAAGSSEQLDSYDTPVQRAMATTAYSRLSSEFQQWLLSSSLEDSLSKKEWNRKARVVIETLATDLLQSMPSHAWAGRLLDEGPKNSSRKILMEPGLAYQRLVNKLNKHLPLHAVQEKPSTSSLGDLKDVK